MSATIETQAVARQPRRLPWAAVTIIFAFVLVGVLAPLVAPADPYEPALMRRLEGPSWEHLLGTDSLGRDVLTRLIYGARASLLVAAVSLGVGALAGIALGLVMGYRRRALDAVLSRFIEVTLAFPPIFFGLLFAVTRGAGIGTVIIAVSLVMWARFARVIRAEVITLSEREFIAQAKVNGASTSRVLTVHMLPNLTGTIMVLLSINTGYVILLEAVLSFLGAGIPPPTASWGGMISDGQAYISTAWWLSLVPGLAILLTVLGLNLFGDWLRDRLDPRLRDNV